MNKIKRKPYVKVMQKSDLQRFLPKEMYERLEGDITELFGVVIDIKAIDKITTPEIFLEYMFGESNKNITLKRQNR